MTLQNLCLNTIVENFDRYFTAYSNSDDVNLKRKLEFLQRIYSQEIATKLFEEFEIEEKHVDFVINKYLKSLDTKWFGNCSWKAVVSKMAEIGPKIKKIYFFEYSEKRPWHEIFCYLPNLEVMHFLRNCADEVLSSIAEYCPNIQEIELRSSYNITNEGFKSLCKVKNGNASCFKLKNILIDCCDVPEDAAKYLVKHLPSLEVFQFYHLPQLLYAMHHKDLPTIDKLKPYKFTKLDLLTASMLPHYGDLLKVCFSLCPNLKSLVCPVIKPQQLSLVSQLSNLETLLIDNYHKDDFLDVNSFLKLKGSKLTSLQLRKCLVSLTTLAKHCPSLNQLHLVNVNVKCDETSIPPFKNLDALTIEISELGVSDENLKSACLILSSSPKLESIAFKKCDLTLSEVKAAILKCCEQSLIKKIDFGSSMVEKQFILDILFTCHSLSVFNLDSCSELDTDDEEEIYKCAELLPNNPDIFFTEQLSVSDYDDIFSDYYDYDNFDFEYDDDDDDEDYYPYDFDPYDYVDYDDEKTDD